MEDRWRLNTALQDAHGGKVDRGEDWDRKRLIKLWHREFGTSVRVDAHLGLRNYLVSEFDRGSAMQGAGKGYGLEVRVQADGVSIARWPYTEDQRRDVMRVQQEYHQAMVAKGG